MTLPAIIEQECRYLGDIVLPDLSLMFHHRFTWYPSTSDIINTVYGSIPLPQNSGCYVDNHTVRFTFSAYAGLSGMGYASADDFINRVSAAPHRHMNDLVLAAYLYEEIGMNRYCTLLHRNGYSPSDGRTRSYLDGYFSNVVDNCMLHLALAVARDSFMSLHDLFCVSLRGTEHNNRYSSYLDLIPAWLTHLLYCKNSVAAIYPTPPCR